MSRGDFSGKSDSFLSNLPPFSPIKITSGVDRYGFSSVLAARCGRRWVPRSFANWVHGWIWADEPSAELLACAKLPRDVTMVVRSEIEKSALVYEGFKDVRVGGLPFAYVKRQHKFRHDDSLLAFPPHSAEAERVTADQSEYLDYLENLRKDFDSIFISVYYLDLHGPLHKAAEARGLRVVQGARPDDANSLLRVRSLLDSFAYVTSNVMGSHMLYALFSGCKFSFSGPMYGYDESEFLAGGNPLGHSSAYIQTSLRLHSEDYLRSKFGEFFMAHPRMGLQGSSFASDAIGMRFLMEPRQIEHALGWNVKDQIDGYIVGARRRLSRALSTRASNLQ